TLPVGGLVGVGEAYVALPLGVGAWRGAVEALDALVAERLDDVERLGAVGHHPVGEAVEVTRLLHEDGGVAWVGGGDDHLWVARQQLVEDRGVGRLWLFGV